jgi:hypothetical protein
MPIIAKLTVVAIAAILGGGSFMVYKIKNTAQAPAPVKTEMPSLVVTTTKVTPGATV